MNCRYRRRGSGHWITAAAFADWKGLALAIAGIVILLGLMP